MKLPAAETAGSFISACFYRYAVVDWVKLVKNLQDDTELAAKGLKAFLEGFVVAEPTGKQNTFAAHNPPEFVAITVRQNGAPRNLANAFETAVRIKKDESLTAVSAARLVEKANKLAAAFDGGDGMGQTFILNLTIADVKNFGSPVDSLTTLLDKSMAALKEWPMPTLLVRLVGPMQSWGTTSRFNQCDTGWEPSKSGVIGLVAAAMGVDRQNWTDLEPLTRLSMGVRHDRPGSVKV